MLSRDNAVALLHQQEGIPSFLTLARRLDAGYIDVQRAAEELANAAARFDWTAEKFVSVERRQKWQAHAETARKLAETFRSSQDASEVPPC